MKKKELKFYFFANTLNDLLIKNIIKFTSIGIIFRENKDINNERELKKIRELCKIKNIPWNFSKFIIDQEGKVLIYSNPR